MDVYLEEDHGRKFYQCEYGWWDHSIAIGNILKLELLIYNSILVFFTNFYVSGELIFLLWGIKVCIAVRKARTYFDEAGHVTWILASDWSILIT